MRLKNQRRIVRKLILAAIVALAITGLSGYLASKYSGPTTSRYSPDVITHSTDVPNEEPVDLKPLQTAQGNEPALLHIPAINVNAPIQKVGIDQHGEIAVPSNINLTGWFVDGAIPGEPGLSIIDGHLDGPSKKGVFWDLARLKPGDTLTIERGDKKILIFEVTSTKTVKTSEAAGVLFSQDPATKSQLNLITCTGTYDKRSRSYDQRIIISTRLINTAP